MKASDAAHSRRFRRPDDAVGQISSDTLDIDQDSHGSECQDVEGGMEMGNR